MKKLPYDETFQCIQCGYCLPACPTYVTMESETHSPRGRINLVKLAAEGLVSLDDLKGPIDLCLGCRACEPACPSGVQYGSILEKTREVLAEHVKKSESRSVRMSKNYVFQRLIPSSKMLRFGADLMWIYQKTGLQKMVHKTKLNRVLPENLRAFEEIMPEVSSPLQRRQRAEHVQPATGLPLKFKVAFFTGCIMDAMFEPINKMSIELLALGGCEVQVITEQTCCGALHSHAGRIEDTIKLAKRNIEAFERLNVDYIVNNAGGCGAMLVEYGDLFQDDPEWEMRAKTFSSKTRDISQILIHCELPLIKKIPLVTTIQPSCHMTNVQKVIQEPKNLLQQIPGIKFLEMVNSNACCGSAGIYNILNYKESMELLNVKMTNVNKNYIDIIVTTNPGCLLQMKLGIHRAGMSEHVRVVHLVELLAESCGIHDVKTL